MIRVGADVGVPGEFVFDGGGVMVEDDLCDGVVDDGEFNSSNDFGDVVASTGVAFGDNFGVVFFDTGDIIIDSGCCDAGSGVVNFDCDLGIGDSDNCDDGKGVTGDICGGEVVNVGATLPPSPLDGLPPFPSPPA